ncbi:alpha/beta hydrolase [Kitasatospora purpeofusca]|uniref:alpha/beta hydrolase n=1 Tax=Kitasatospora purpeofusca TaxID=67352 RepID=UPI0004C18623|nr:alpha/beta hydrolase [Kitasatospora purpeofusca]
MSDSTTSDSRGPVLDGGLGEFLATRARRPDAASGESAPLDLSFLAGPHPSDAHQDTVAGWLALPTPAGHVRIQVIRPVDAARPTPVVLFLHGLGWVLGDADSYRHLLREFAVGADAAVVFVDYGRPPAARFPVAVEQCYAVACWIAEHGHEIGLDGSRIAAAGDSAGANLVAALTLLLRRRGGARLLHQVLLCPVTDADFDTPSYRDFAEGYFLHRADMRRYWDAYLPDPADRTQPAAAPLRARPDELTGLPPALVITAEADVLRDEGEAYAARLRSAGVPVVSTRYQGVVHGFVLLDSHCRTASARAALVQAVDTLHLALHRHPW